MLFFMFAISQCNFKETARNLFQACHIEVSDEDEDIDYNQV